MKEFVVWFRPHAGSGNLDLIFRELPTEGTSRVAHVTPRKEPAC